MSDIDATIESRLAAARTRLILDKPFLGALVLRLPLKPAAWCRTTATDAQALYYNPRWIDSLSNLQVQFALAHEALHCALGHFARRAREAGKLSGPLARLAEAALAVQVSWRALLAQYLSQAARDDYTWLRPSRREGEVIWPSLRSHSGDIHVAIDVSGSVTEQDLAGFLGEINALKGTTPVRITLFACDSDLAAGAPWTFEPWDELRLPQQFAGGGGTSFVPVFEWIDRHGMQPDSLVYFTDAEGEFPPEAPNYPVLWLVKGKAPVPFGRRIQLNG